MAANFCIDDDGLAALFAHGACDSRDSIEAHLDGCADCRELVAAYARAADDSNVEGVLSAAESDVIRGWSTALAPVTSSDAPRPGRIIAQRYVLEHVVGEGGMGTIWSARDLATPRRVALKLLKAGSRELARRSLREARAAAYVGHPSLLEVLEVVPAHAEHDAPILVLPLLSGESLDRVLLRGAPLSARFTIEAIEPVVAGMHAAHARGVIHRDLKPSNVFFAEDGSGERTVFVLDFGLVKFLSADGTDAGADELTRTGALVGTPWYMAPEQLFGDASVDHRADVWAIGAMLYECLSGRRPIEGRSYGQVARNAARGEVAPLHDGVDPVLAALTARMLDMDRDGRPDLSEVHAALLTWLDRH